MCLSGKYKGYLLDLDGTIYRGEALIPGAVEFVDRLVHEDIPYVFVTNNASMAPEQIVGKLNRLGIQAEVENILTSALAAAAHIQQLQTEMTVYVIGEDPLIHACEAAGLQVCSDGSTAVEYVLMGLDRNITYEKLTRACLLIREGAQFISTNPDLAIPKERGFYPGNGALTQVVSSSTGIAPIHIGKPETIIMEQALTQLGVAKQDVVMVGDNLLTDIQAGMNAELDTLLVLTGVATETEVEKLVRKPTEVIKNLTDWLPYI